MSAFLFALVAVVLTSLGSRDQLLVSRLSDRLGRHVGLLVAALVVSTATAGLMAWGGWTVSAMLPPAAKSMLVALALLLAAVELAWPNRRRALVEPTRSVGAMAIVLAGYQITDGARFLIFALAAALPATALAAAGGAIGGCLALAAAWSAPEKIGRMPLRMLRLLLAGVLMVASIVIGLSARGLID
uniref:hypothetical protein n=1 Tax=Parerythrobacter lutipelagi TaxID=1964208 RepID=UPI0010F7490C|nr:hypothetical protein [Parerythrobacter lutipelagi]